MTSLAGLALMTSISYISRIARMLAYLQEWVCSVDVVPPNLALHPTAQSCATEK